MVAVAVDEAPIEGRAYLRHNPRAFLVSVADEDCSVDMTPDRLAKKMAGAVWPARPSGVTLVPLSDKDLYAEALALAVEKLASYSHIANVVIVDSEKAIIRYDLPHITGKRTPCLRHVRVLMLDYTTAYRAGLL